MIQALAKFLIAEGLDRVVGKIMNISVPAEAIQTAPFGMPGIWKGCCDMQWMMTGC